MLDDELKKSAMEKITTMSANEYKKAFKDIGSLQTNEEWFCELQTEEKAKAIVCLAHNASALAIEYHCTDVEAICIWLKEVHKE